MTTDLRQWLETMAAEAATARDAEPPQGWSNGWHDGNRAAYHAVLTWLGDHPNTADRDRAPAWYVSCGALVPCRAPKDDPRHEPSLRKYGGHDFESTHRTQPPAPAATDSLRGALDYIEFTLDEWMSEDEADHPVRDCIRELRAALAQPPAPAPTAETLRDAAQGQVVAWSARAASLRMLRSERAIGEAIGLAQAAAELDAIVLTVPDAARAEPLDVEALAKALDSLSYREVERWAHDGMVSSSFARDLAAAYEEARRRG